ncbi:hypothetical protein Mal4_51280 [Maioricimonas rarisocia]|uniref:Uncharacterized protein n=2 Tax=Maioricimonas rarisocia TaxID=2528026 RepID=A0A517ZE63_9PLAN|nr:hypothetical protein Mal4_51280 [Maioricimonas rarisocia]
MVREVRFAWDDDLNPGFRDELLRRHDLDDGPDELEPDPSPRRTRSRRRRPSSDRADPRPSAEAD